MSEPCVGLRCANPTYDVHRSALLRSTTQTCKPRIDEARSTLQLADEVTGAVAAVQLILDDALPCGHAGAGGTGQAEDQSAVSQTGSRTGLDGGGADFLVG